MISLRLGCRLLIKMDNFIEKEKLGFYEGLFAYIYVFRVAGLIAAKIKNI